MKKDWQKYNSFEEWDADGRKYDSYYKEETKFKFICKCGGQATLWCEYDMEYAQQNVIVCDACGYEEGIYGVDG